MRSRLLLAPILLAAACSRGKEPLTVLAASSLQETVEEAARLWTERTGKPVRLQFGASSTLARQVLEGAPADLFLSAHPEWTRRVKAAARFDWLGNRLAVAVPAGAPAPDLRRLKALALAGEEVPAGRYAREALEGMGIPLPPRVVYGANVRDVLSKVSSGAAPAGIVYATDVSVDPALRTAFLLPDGRHSPIRVTAALLTERARGLFEFLRSPEVRSEAEARGFHALP